MSTKPLLQAARKALSSEGAARAEVTVVLTDDESVRVLNRDYRFQDKPTDVLSFAQRDPAEAPPLSFSPGAAEILGDVVISVETVHGILHLLGYEDETEEGAEEMRRREGLALAAVGIRNHRDVDFLPAESRSE